MEGPLVQLYYLSFLIFLVFQILDRSLQARKTSETQVSLRTAATRKIIFDF